VKLASGAAALSCLAVVTSAPLVMALPAATAGVSPAVSASATTTGASLVGDLLTRQWSISPGSGAAGAATAGAVTTSLLDTTTGVDHAGAASADFSLTANGMAVTSAAGWTSVTAVAGTAAADPSHSPGPLGLPAQTVTFTYALTTGPAQLIVTRQYRLAPGDAMTEVRTSLAAVGAPVVVSNWTVDELTMRPAPSAQVVELHSGSSYTSRHSTVHEETASFDDQGEVAVAADGPGSGVLIVNEHRSGPSTRMQGTVGSGSARLAAGVEPGREFAIVPVENVSGTDTDNSVANPAYPVAGQTETVLPGSPLDLGAAYLGVFSGGTAAAPAVLQRHLAGSTLISAPIDVQQNTFHPFNDGTNMNDTTMLAQATASHALGAGTLILDDGWEGGTNGLAGDWRLDPAKFASSNGPAAAPDIIAKVHATGERFGLWMEALLFNPKSTVYQAHPDWACAPTGDASAQVPDSNGLGYWDATNTAWQAYMTGVVDRLVSAGVDEFKLDNEQWMDCGTSTYTQYQRAWEALVRTWQARHPTTVFQLDETIDERSYPYAGLALGPTWFEDDHVKATSHPGATQLSQTLSDLWQTTPWVPPSTMGIPLFHNTLSGTSPDGTAGYQLPFSLLGQATFWTDTASLSPADTAETKWWTSWYAAHHAAYTGLVLNDSVADPIDDLTPIVLQPWDHVTKTGYLTVVRQGGGPPGPQTLTVSAQDTDPTRSYQLTDVRTGEALGSYTGAALQAGIPVTMTDRFRTRVISLSSAQPAAALSEGHLLYALPVLLIMAVIARRRTRVAPVS